MTGLAVRPPRDEDDPGAAALDRGGKGVPRWALASIVPISMLVLWEQGAMAGVVSTRLIPAPSAIIGTLSDLATEGNLIGHSLSTTMRVLAGFVLGATVATALGAATGVSERFSGLGRVGIHRLGRRIPPKGGDVIELRQVSKRFDSGLLAVSGVDLTVAASEIVAVIGPSGCGKSTVLRLMAGLDTPTTGSVRVAGHQVDGPDPSVGVVFQEPRLMPWLSVELNVSFGLAQRGGDDGVAAEAIERVGLGAFARSLPKELSGGMAQRTAIARALVTKPPVLLLDEPFSALDAFTRVDLQDHLLDVWGWYRPTMFLVTHDIDEALVLADRVLVFGGLPGSIQSEVVVDLPRPRDRTDHAFHSFQDLTMRELGRSRRASPALRSEGTLTR